MSDANQRLPPPRDERLLLAQCFNLLTWGVVLWIALFSGALDIPVLTRWGVPPSTLPGLLWMAAAWRVRNVRDWTPAWNSVTRRLLAAAALHLYLIPYLGWWQTGTPELYQRFNTLLLAAAAALGATGAYRLVYETARRLDDRILRVETALSIVAIPVLAGGFWLLLRWSAHRAGASDASILEWYQLLRDVPGGPRIALMLIVLLPLMPMAILFLEARARVLTSLAAEGPPQNQA